MTTDNEALARIKQKLDDDNIAMRFHRRGAVSRTVCSQRLLLWRDLKVTVRRPVLRSVAEIPTAHPRT
jgi:hypothetical protein